jgi:SAM-dependent methyltransferase
MGRFALMVRRWRQFLANRGVIATSRTILSGLARRFARSTGGAQTPSELWRNADTGGLIWGESLPTGHRHDAWNTAYYGIAPSAFEEALGLLRARASLDWTHFTFIDLGSGKGRAVLLASQYPFARVLGVELTPQLHATAAVNLARFPGATHVECIQADAAEFPWEHSLSGSLLFFLYNPFSRPVLAKFLARLRHALRAEPRVVYLLYVNPELDSALTRQGWIEKLWQETIAIDDADQMADRFGSTTETVAAYRCRSLLR